ncbi:MAG: glycoside hydrolase family 5 protein, partial [Lachnospiraceae bacterium]|nr:glycoside hydrolase family 5 protein [Lachnospiraceae bacterium]
MKQDIFKKQSKSKKKGASLKRALSLLITLSLTLSCLSVFSFADTVNSGDFTVTQQVNSTNEYWHEYTYTVKNNTSQGVSSVILLIPTSGDMEKCETYGNQSLTYDSQAGGILLYAPVSISAGGSVQLEKMGLNPKTYSISISDAKVYAVNESKSWSSTHEYGDSSGSGSGSGSGTSSSSQSLEYELTGELKDLDLADTPVGKHGKLHLATVEKYGNAPVIVDEQGAAVQLRGASTHGMQWDICTPFINEEAFHTFRDEWGVNLIRLVCYPRDYNGYLNGGKDMLDGLIVNGMNYAKNLGMYAIVDWHVHQYNPNEDKEAAKTFFAKYSEMYADYDNVLYEICNEPTNTPWYDGSGNDIYTYANEIIPIIRANDDDAIIIVGTNTWSQDVDDVHNKPITDYDNIMYTFHFYSGSHGSSFRERVTNAINAGTPVFITEFGICDSSGNGNVQTAEADL